MKMGLNNFTCLSTSALFFIHMLFDVWLCVAEWPITMHYYHY